MSIEARRHSPRVKLSETAYINFGSGNRGVVRDISDGGLGFSATSRIQSDREIRFRLPSSDKSRDKSSDKYEVIAEIAWNDDSRTRGGLRFKTVPAEVRAQLRAWMDDQRLPSAGKSDGNALELGAPTDGTVAVEVTGLGPEVARSRESEERVAAAAVEILAAERTGDQAPESPVSNTPERTPSVQEAVTASTASFSFSAVPLGSFSRTVPGTSESELTMFPLEPTRTGGYTFSSRAQKSRRNLLGVAVAILLCAAGASAAAVWYVYPSQTRYEVQRIQDRIARLIPTGSKAGSGQPISNVEPASIGGGASDDEIAGAIPESAPTAPDVTGTRRPDVSDSASKPEVKTDSGENSPNPDAASAAEKNAEPARNESDTELALARTYLGSDGTPDQKVKAVQLLWLATEKGNIDAEIQLADLYASGENVPKSCVQARILLKAAEVANPSAAEPKLKELDQTGCS